MILQGGPLLVINGVTITPINGRKKWVTGAITLLIGVTILSITCRGPPLVTVNSLKLTARALPRTPGPKRNVTTTIEFRVLLLLVSGSVNFAVGEGSMIPIYLLPSLKLTARTWKWMVGRRLFPFGARPIFRGYVSFREGNKQRKSRVWLPVPFWVHCKCERAFFPTKWGMWTLLPNNFCWRVYVDPASFQMMMMMMMMMMVFTIILRRETRRRAFME